MLFSKLLNDDTADIEKPDGICSTAFVVDICQSVNRFY